jgi:tetratricopeptide (TPR) repeat protein
MARAAVKAKQREKRGAAQVQPKVPARGRSRRRGHAGGGNPNQQLFFMRLRRRAKFVYVLLAVLFAATFAFLGVGSGSSGLDQLFSGLHLFRGGGNAVKSAQDHIRKNPKDPKGYRELATAYEAKGDTPGAIASLQQYTRMKPSAVKEWTELAGLQLTLAQNLAQQYAAAYQNAQAQAPGQALSPGGKLGTALGANPIETAAAQQAQGAMMQLQTEAQSAFNSAVTSYTTVTNLHPNDANAWFQLAQASQASGNVASALQSYRKYLQLDPNSTSAAQIRQLMKQLAASATATPPATPTPSATTTHG